MTSGATILCVESDPNEMERAKKAIKNAGYEFNGLLVPCSREIGGGIEIFKTAIENSSGVLTTLYFNPFGYKTIANYGYGTNKPPAGLMIIIHALSRGIPAVICSDMDMGVGGREDPTYHHGDKYAWLYDWYFFNERKPSRTAMPHKKYSLLPTYLIGEKNWDRAVEVLHILMEASIF
jgi:hypothetical protein